MSVSADRQPDYLIGLIVELCKLPGETTWIEFKENYAEPQEIGEYISALSNALVFFQLPFGIFSISIVTVLFPKMSRQAALEDREGLVDTVSYGLQFILILMVPASLLYIVLGKQIIAVAMQRGAFTAQGTAWAAQVLRAYSYGLCSLSACSINKSSSC